MNCNSCGKTINEEVKFCKYCGKEVNKNLGMEVDKALFYSEGWTQTKFFAIASIPSYDILITKTNFYLINFPNTNWGTIGCILGFFILTLLGAIIGALIGGNSDNNLRKNLRATWINKNHELISNDYEKNIFIKITKDKLKNSLVFKGNNCICIKKDNTIITLKNNKDELKRFKTFIGSYIA
jgi:hypothetical protein